MNSIRGRRCSLVTVMLVGTIAAGCERGGEQPADIAIDTVGSTIIVTNPEEPRGRLASAGGDSLRHLTLDTTRAREVASIGVEDGASEQMFGTISSIAVDPAGRLYVSDAMAEDVRVYSPGGEFIERIGRGGDGPGEFRRPTGLAFDSRGRLYVRDETKVQRFRPEAGTSSLRYAGSSAGPAYGYSLASSRIDTNGRLYYPRRAGRIPDQKYFYLVLDSAGAVVDTLAVPASVKMPTETAIYRTGRSGGRMVQGLSRAPFAPVASWDVTPDGNLLLTEGAAYEIVEINPSGDTVRVIRRSSTPRPVPARELRDSTRAVSERVADAPAPVEQLEGVAEEIRTGRLPTTLPAIRSVHVGTDGRIWVQRWPPEGGQTSIYDVFSREGVYRTTVVLPARLAELPHPVFSERRVYGITVDPETEVQRIRIFEFSSP